MPRKTDGKSLKTYVADVWYSGKGEFTGQQIKITVQACNLQGAVGRAAREGRKQLKGRFSEATITVYQLITDQPIEAPLNDSEPTV